MGNFCKGILVGFSVGACVSAVSIVKNKRVFGMVKNKTEIAQRKLSNLMGKIKQKLDEKPECECNCCEENANLDTQITENYNN